jgi:CRP/FNR family nitrogen fixation transcriptional regulator
MITLSTARITPSAAGLFSNASWPAQIDATSGPVTLTDYLQAIQSYGARQHYQRNETIFNQDDPAEQVYRILDGTVRLCRHMPDGRRYIVDFLLPGDVMGFVESPDQPVSAEAVTEVSLTAFPRICFDRLARENAGMRKQLLCHMSENLLTAQQHLFVLGCQKANERVASFLLRLADRLDVSCGNRLDLTMSRQDIADHLGLTIETISRAFGALRGQDIILIPNAHQLIVRNMVALRALASEG